MEYTPYDNEKLSQTPLGSNQKIAATVGEIIALFSLIEYAPGQLMRQMFNVRPPFDQVIATSFRAFSSRLSLIENLQRTLPETDERLIISRYFKGQLTIANKIRNKYAYALYAAGSTRDTLTLFPFGSDANRRSEAIQTTVAMVEGDRDTIGRTVYEFSLLLRNEIPQSLHKELVRQRHEISQSQDKSLESTAKQSQS